MSVNEKHFVMIGIDIGGAITDNDYKTLEPYMEEGKELYCLYDGMNGEYVILGEIIHVGNGYDGMSIQERNFNELNDIAERVKDNLRKFRKLFDVDNYEPQLISVTHHY